MIYNNIISRQNISLPLRIILILLNHITELVLYNLHSTTQSLIISAFAQNIITIQNLIANAMSQINISFDFWSSDDCLSLLGIWTSFLDRKKQPTQNYLYETSIAI